ncbi:MAG: HAMP domain-containing sensor histidine kinase [Chitinophagaceae bacterium]
MTIAGIVLLGRYSQTAWMWVGIGVLLVELASWYRSHTRLLQEFRQFVEGVRYHDFSQHFNVNGKGIVFPEFKAGFNIINKEFLDIGKEREKQYQYLQKIMDLVDTGILLYESNSGEVMWMNEALRNILGIPFFKNVHALHWRYSNLLQTIEELSGRKKIVVTLAKERMHLKLQLSCSVFQVEGNLMKLIVFQNINEVVDITESQAWHKLLRVLTHEIMNSVAPISSLAATLYNNIDTMAPNNIDDLRIGINTIKNRSEGLLKFAEAYRNLNKIENPQLSRFLVRDLFASLDILFEPTLLQHRIELEIILKNTNLKITADRSLLDQTFINLMLNAIDAVKDAAQPCIQLYAEKLDENTIELKVLDNGKGMSIEVQERIFIPFFSTKGTGSGVGLSLCKQIVLLHGGSIDVHSIVDKGTAFTMDFPEIQLIEE